MNQPRREVLGGGVEVWVSPRHTFGTDAFLLSHFASPKPYETACDLGCGCGIIPLLWFREGGGPKTAVAVDIQPEAISLARQSVEASGLSERLSVVEGDIRDLPPELPRGSFHLVTSNPPYKKIGAGEMSREESAQIARHETLCDLDDIFRGAASLLRYGGRLCVCQLPERLPDVLEGMRHHRIEPKRLRFVQERSDTPPWLLLCEGKLGSKPFLQVERPFLMRENGEDSPELGELYRLYRKQP